MTDIRDTTDLETLFAEFYKELLSDDEMRHIFIDVAKVNIGNHLPVIVSFWEQVVFGTGDYKSNVLMIHQDLNKYVRLEKHHFKKWLDTLFTIADFRFSGENCEKLKTRALSISQVIQIKLKNV